jgi:hypothetical protein
MGWVAGAVVGGAIGLVFFLRPAPPADTPATSPGVDVVEEIAAPEPLPARAAAPSDVVEQNRQATTEAANEQAIPAPPVWGEIYAAESIDPEWAPRAQTDIVSKFAEQPGLKLIALQVECRTTMCQVQMTEPSSTALDPLAREPPMRLLKTVGMQLLSLNVVNIQTNMMTSVAYLSRPGHEPFPQIEPFPQLRQHAADPPEPLPAR